MLKEWLPQLLNFRRRDAVNRRVVERDQQSAMMAAISDAVLAVDQQGAPLFYNSRFAMLVSDRDLQARRLWKIVVDPDTLKAFQAALRDGRATTVNAVPFDQATGRQFYSVSVSPLREDGGGIYGAVGIFRDVTELKRAEQIRIDFVANVSHELRTPLAAIKGYADTLLGDLEDGKAADIEFVRVIVKNADRLMSLINDLLDLSSIESTDVLHKDVLSTLDFTSYVLEQIRESLEKKQRKVELVAEAPTVVADPKRLEQVLINLVDNANKYTPAGAPIFVRWKPASEGGVLLLVSDNGPGIPLDQQARLFERFYRVDKARSREMGGTGLGLAIVKHILLRHGGSVSVDSAPGKGATFICWFP